MKVWRVIMFQRKHSVYLLALLFSFILAGCGQKITQPVSPIETTMGPDDAKATIVIMPFADYSSGDRVDNPLRRQVKVHAALAYRLVQYGYYTPVEEDVMQYLSDRDISIAGPTAGLDDAARRTVEREMASGWSDNIKGKINQLIEENEQGNAAGSGLQGDVGLSQQILRNVGRHFDADYVLRGRIIEYTFCRDSKTAIVELGLVLQDVRTGKVAWANRVKEEVHYRSLWSEASERQQIDTAIERAADVMVKDLASTLARMPVPEKIHATEEVEQNPLPCGTEKSGTIMEEPVSNTPIKKEEPANWGS